MIDMTLHPVPDKDTVTPPSHEEDSIVAAAADDGADPDGGLNGVDPPPTD
jgi:hypothetical protein